MIQLENYNRKEDLDRLVEEMEMDILTEVHWEITPTISDLESGELVEIDILFPPEKWMSYSDEVRERYREYVKELIRFGAVPLDYLLSKDHPQGVVIKL
jgi:hypothetical protein